MRLKGYREALHKAGINVNPSYVKYGDYTLESGYKSMLSLLLCDDRPTAVFASNYEMTMGAVMALHEKNIVVPKDMAIIGFDDMVMTSVVSPPLTAIAQPIEMIGRKAAALLLRRIHGDNDGMPQHICCPTTLIKRKSV